jgi:RNA polymerase sigma-70 factor (ECF subfamily)
MVEDSDSYRDTELLLDFMNGSSKAFEHIYDQYYERLYFFGYGLIDNREEAKDITLTTLNKLFEKHKDFDNLPQLAGFLYVTVRNSCLNHLRHRKIVYDKNMELLSTYKEEDQVNDELDADFIQAVLRSVERLPERSRQVVNLYYLEGLKYRQIAEQLDISPRSVENQLRYALDKLRTALAGKRAAGIWLLATPSVCKWLAQYILLLLHSN